jgi:hypothetical protein
MRPIVFAAGATLITACASTPRYEFRPTLAASREDAPGDVAGHPAATYPIRDGEVKVAALGVDKLAHRIPAVHLRLIVRNGSHGIWTIDVQKQEAFITAADEEVALPAAIAEDATTFAVLTPEDTRTLDLYYPLPDTVRDGASIQKIRLDWRIGTPTSYVFATHETPFERHELPPPPTVPSDPKRRRNTLQAIPDDDGLPRPGSAEPSLWSSWRD